MPSKIRILTDHTINKIAAGEVIENPASVVKELVENSLDAGATEVSVEIKGGGRQLIRVTDNGFGMNSDDALLCLERHATSKIREVEDLNSITTMGFRGEAIPSIAAISKFTFLTCPNSESSDSVGTMVIVDGGKILKCSQVACHKGTTFEIKSLFFNVPVRKKFQKSPVYDSNEIYKIMCLLSLGNPSVKFQLINNEKNVLLAPWPISDGINEKFGERISAVLGDEVFQAMRPLNGIKGNCILQGFIGLPSFTRQNRTGQYLFINQRAVYSPFISYSIREGYGPSIGSNRYPVFALNLSLPGNLVDVNVHPQKKEVRLRQEYLLKEMIIRAVEKAMQGNVSPFNNDSPLTFEISPPFEFAIPSNSAYSSDFPSTFPTRSYNEEFKSNSPIHDFKLHPSPPSFNFASPNQKLESENSPSLFTLSSSPLIPRVVTTIPGYILIDPTLLGNFKNDGLCLVDQRAAHCRIIYEKLLKIQLNAKKEKIFSVQSLLIPYELETNAFESSLLLNKLEYLNLLGISIRKTGDKIFTIDAIPEVFGNTDLKEFLSEIIQDLHHFNNEASEKSSLHQIALAASRASVSKNKKLSFEEAQAMLSQLMLCQSPYQCPFGKPTMAQINSEDLAKQFNKN
jgi:DNA mismatch repair protein MutL